MKTKIKIGYGYALLDMLSRFEKNQLLKCQIDIFMDKKKRDKNRMRQAKNTKLVTILSKEYWNNEK